MEALGLICFYSITACDDMKSMQVKVREILIFAFIGIAFNIIFRPYSLLSVAGGVMIGCVVLLFSYFSNEKIGIGDSLIIIVTGLFLGFADTLLLLWVSTIMAAIFGMIFIKKYGKEKDYEIPFVPFLLMGYLLIYMVKGIGGLVVCG